ncbi:hypothetical protein [Lacticaseibacillus zhaodongensis]|uniref:hypothetical protein n=1 Tax=Lacticaseibacillus zhaodongensis TaxID=2668065 RepID=UPI0012D357BB|nr:hypothetical protein [Lacticaseibacillus zhaodongensis]
MSFQYSLRYTLDPQTNTAEQNTRLLHFCQRAQIDNVTFFINPEELNCGHLDAAQTQVWLDAIKPVQEQLRSIGVTTSLNPWTTVMHSDRGQKLNPALGFSTMVDINGRQAETIACPGDPGWQDYIAARYAQYASLQPEELWLEDDFRHYNHTPLKLGCFCPRHMAQYCAKLGREVSRAEFVQELLAPGTPTAARKVYLDVARAEMKRVAAQIERAVHAVAPQTHLALMTSFPDWHAVEGRDWPGLFTALSGSQQTWVARPHLPAYNEIAPLKYARVFERYTRTTAAYLGDNAELMPELESYMYSPFVKSKRFTQFQLETASLVGARGILLNLFDMAGNGIDESYGYVQMLAGSKPFLQQISTHRVRMAQTRGIKVLVDQDSSYTLHTAHGQDPVELLPQETNWAELLSTFGFSTTITPWPVSTALTGEFIAISGQLLRNLATTSITELIKNNTVFLDGQAVQVLLDQGLGDLIHITASQWHGVRTGYQSYEAADGHSAEGVLAPRITMLQHTGDYLQLEYAVDSNVDVWSHAYSAQHDCLGNNLVRIDGHIIVMPMGTDPKYGWESQYIGFRQSLYQQMLADAPLDYLIGTPNVKLVVDTHAETVLTIANFTLDDYPQLRWHPAKQPQSLRARVYTRRGDACRQQDIELIENDNYLLIPVELCGMAVMQIVLD